jgi:hypothetical protein
MDEDEDFDPNAEYLSETLVDAVPTPYDPKFVLVPELALSSIQLQEMRVDDLITAYIALRNQLATDRKGYKAREQKMKDQLVVISMNLRAKGDELGVDNFKTAGGTAYRSRTEKIRVGDWDQFLTWMIETENYHLVQKRVSPNLVKEVRDKLLADIIAGIDPSIEKAEMDEALAQAAQAAIPPGLVSVPEETFAVRSPAARKK